MEVFAFGAPVALFCTCYASKRNTLPLWRCLPGVEQRMAKFVQTSFGRAHYHHHGCGKSNLVVVMLAGIGHDPSYWPELLEWIGQQYEVVAVDLFGRGCTDAGWGYRTERDYVEFISQVIEAIGLVGRPIVMCGFSFGGAVAAQAAANLEAVIGALLFVPAGVAVSSTFGSGITMSRYLPRGLADVAGVFASIGGLFCFGRTGRTEDTTEPGYNRRARRVRIYSWQDFFLNPSFFRSYMHTLRHFPLGAGGFNIQNAFRELRRLGSRVELIVASNDTIIPSDKVKEFVFEELPEASVREVCGGHDVQWDRPVQTAELICEFLERIKK